MKRYFILGTDTDCGKTYVTAQLVDALKQHGQHVSAVKPLASGCTNGVSEDALCLNRHNDRLVDEQGMFRLCRPIAPHIAAAEEGIELTAASVAMVCESFDTNDLDVLLIEGAGGLMVPLNAEETWIDWLIQTKIPVVLVVGMRLGCINHALLTTEVLKQHQIECVGWVANCLDPEMLALEENIQTLVARLSAPLLGVVPFKGTMNFYDIGNSEILKFESTSSR